MHRPARKYRGQQSWSDVLCVMTAGRDLYREEYERKQRRFAASPKNGQLLLPRPMVMGYPMHRCEVVAETGSERTTER